MPIGTRYMTSIAQEDTMGYAVDVLKKDILDKITILKEGLDFRAFEETVNDLAINKQDLARIIGLPLRTMHRRRGYKLSQYESERLLRVISVWQMTVDMFDGNIGKARKWFNTSKIALGGNTPLAYCETEIGAAEVQHLIGRIQHGAFS